MGDFYGKFKEKNKTYNRELYRKRHPGSKRYASSWKVTNIIDGKERRFSSEKALIVFLGYSQTCIKNYIVSKKPLGGYLIERLYEE